MNEMMRVNLILIFLLAVSCAGKQKGTKPEVKDLTEAVYASGNIYPKEEYLVFADAGGLLQKKFVDEGDFIHKGQPLFKIENDIQDVQKRTSQRIYETALENYGRNSPALAESENAVKNALQKLKNDSINYVRYKTLWEGEATTKAELDQVELAYSVSRNDYLARKNSLKNLKRNLYVSLQNAENQYKVSVREDKNYLLTALMDGMVYEIYKEEGEAIRQNDPVALVGNEKDIYIKLAVDEMDIEKVKVGQEVFVKIDLFKDTIFKAEITKIHPKLNIQDQSFRVDAKFSGGSPSSYYGLTVEANILIQEKKHILTLPKSYLVSEDSVWVKTPEGVKKIRIKKGIEDFDYVEVLGKWNKNWVVLKKGA